MTEFFTGKYLPYITIAIGALVTLIFMIFREDITKNRSIIKRAILFVPLGLIAASPIVAAFFDFHYFFFAIFSSLGMSVILVSIHIAQVSRWRVVVQDKLQNLETELKQLQESQLEDNQVQ